MNTVNEALALLKRQAELETARKRPGVFDLCKEQELPTIRQGVGEFPEAARAILQAAHGRRRPVAEVTAAE